MTQDRQPEDSDIEGQKHLSSERLEHAILSIPHPLAIWDAEHRLLAMNPAYERLVSEVVPHHSPDTPLHILGRSIIPKLTFESENDLNAFLTERAARRLSGDDDYDVTLLGDRTLHVTTRRTSDADTVLIAVKAERKHSDAASPVAAHASEAREKELSLELAHRLRTPLNAMMGFAQLLGHQGSEPLSEQQRLMVNRILEAGGRLEQVIHDNEVIPVQSSRLPEQEAQTLDAEPPSKPKTILYVEDDSANVALLEAFFENNPHAQLKTAGSVEEGLELARSSPPDVVFMDINLPGTGGFDGLRILRSAESTRRIPVIALTAAPLPADGEAANFDFHLSKPLLLEELEAALRAVLVLT